METSRTQASSCSASVEPTESVLLPLTCAQRVSALLHTLATTTQRTRQSAFPVPDTNAESETESATAATASGAPGITPPRYAFDAEELRALQTALRTLVDLTHPQQPVEKAKADADLRGLHRHFDCHSCDHTDPISERGSVGTESAYGDVATASAALQPQGALGVVCTVLTVPAEADKHSTESHTRASSQPSTQPSPTPRALFLSILAEFEAVLLHDVCSAMLMAALVANICSSCSRANIGTCLGATASTATSTPPSLAGDRARSDRRNEGDGHSRDGEAAAAKPHKRDQLKKLLGISSHDNGCSQRASISEEATATTAASAAAADQAVRAIRAAVPATACWELLLVTAQRYKVERRTLHFLLTVIADVAFVPLLPVRDADCRALVDLVLPAYTEPAVVEAWLTALCNLTALHPRMVPMLLAHNVVEVVERLVLFHGGRDAVIERGLEVLSNMALEMMEETSTIHRHRMLALQQQEHQHAQQVTPTQGITTNAGS